MTARDIIADIDAILRGDISGPEQVRGVLKEAQAALAALDGGEAVPVAWMHMLHMERGQTHVRLSDDPDDEPFGEPEVDYSPEYSVTVTPLYAHPPRSEVERAVAEERERCARIAEQFNGQKHAAYDMATGVFPKQSYMGEAIAAAIRSTP